MKQNDQVTDGAKCTLSSFSMASTMLGPKGGAGDRSSTSGMVKLATPATSGAEECNPILSTAAHAKLQLDTSGFMKPRCALQPWCWDS
eukprot:6477617-Amphidinium_carterae.1